MSAATTPPSPNVAVLDLGSNSLKVLVATLTAEGKLAPLLSKSLDVRISAGLGAAHPQLSAEGMARGVDAVQELLAAIAPFTPARTLLVATSAVRDARNGADFRSRVQAATGHEIRILSGEEEAGAIGHGLLSDPTLGGLRDFQVFDLGGGSLECLTYRDRRLVQGLSLRLGCVRLTEQFVSDPAAPFSEECRARIHRHVQDTLAAGGFHFAPPPSTAIATGGTVSTARAILGLQCGREFSATPAQITVRELRHLLDETGNLPLAQRRQVPGLPPARADVFPTALATMLAVAEAGQIPLFRHSLHNLRYGLASELLATL